MNCGLVAADSQVSFEVCLGFSSHYCVSSKGKIFCWQLRRIPRVNCSSELGNFVTHRLNVGTLSGIIRSKVNPEFTFRHKFREQSRSLYTQNWNLRFISHACSPSFISSLTCLQQETQVCCTYKQAPCHQMTFLRAPKPWDNDPGRDMHGQTTRRYASNDYEPPLPGKHKQNRREPNPDPDVL